MLGRRLGLLGSWLWSGSFVTFAWGVAVLVCGGSINALSSQISKMSKIVEGGGGMGRVEVEVEQMLIDRSNDEY